MNAPFSALLPGKEAIRQTDSQVGQPLDASKTSISFLITEDMRWIGTAPQPGAGSIVPLSLLQH